MFSVTIDDGSNVRTRTLTREEIASLFTSGGWWITVLHEDGVTYVNMLLDYTVEIE